MTFYNYIYCDPTRPSSVVWDDVVLPGEPFYVGKGKGERFLDHLKRNDHHPVTHRIAVIRSRGYEPIVLKVTQDCEEGEALMNEILMIDFIGCRLIARKDGPLLNLTKGGDGIVGYSHSQETRRKLSEAGRGRKISEEHRAAIKQSQTGKPKSEAHKAKLSKLRKGITTGARPSHSEKMKAIWAAKREVFLANRKPASAELRQQRSERLKERHRAAKERIPQ